MKWALGLQSCMAEGGFSGASTEILYIIIERLQLADLKNLIYGIDHDAFIAIENLHEVSSGKQGPMAIHKKKYPLPCTQSTRQINPNRRYFVIKSYSYSYS